MEAAQEVAEALAAEAAEVDLAVAEASAAVITVTIIITDPFSTEVGDRDFTEAVALAVF